MDIMPEGVKITSKIPELTRQLQNLYRQRKVTNAVKNEAEEAAMNFHYRIVQFLKEKRYPIRRGTEMSHTSDRVDKYRGTTPTERLHPGSPPLWQGQQPPVMRKIRGEVGVDFSFDNISEHAKYFFNEIKEHDIPAPSSYPLRFPFGENLPWKPRGIEGEWIIWGGGVHHPGKEDYTKYIFEMFFQDRKDFEDATERAANNVMDIISFIVKK